MCPGGGGGGFSFGGNGKPITFGATTPQMPQWGGFGQPQPQPQFNFGQWAQQFQPQQPQFNPQQWQQMFQPLLSGQGAGTPFPGMPQFPQQAQPPQFDLQQWAQQFQPGAPGGPSGGSGQPTNPMMNPMIQQAMAQAPAPGAPNAAMQYATNQFDPSHPPAAPQMPGMAAGGRVRRKSKVVLTPEQRAIARMLGMSDLEYARNVLRMRAEQGAQ